MKLNTLFLGLTLALSTTTVFAFEHVYIIDINYDKSPKLVGDKDANASPEFVEFPNKSVGFEGYTETNFGGDMHLVNADNLYLIPFEMFKSYKVVNTTSTSYQESHNLYLQVEGGSCVNVSYRIPSLDIGMTNINEFCPEGQAHKVLDFSTLEMQLKPSDLVEVLISSTNNEDKQLIGAFEVSTGENNAVKVLPGSIISSSMKETNYIKPNLINIGGYY